MAPTTTAAPTTTQPPDDTALALDVLAFIPVQLEQQANYDRDLFSEGLGVNGDGCNTRAEVLIRDSTIGATPIDGCSSVAGRWTSPYDGMVTDSPQALEVDHVVSLKEAWDSGAWSGTDDQRSRFANDLTDPRSLRAVTAASNQSKSDADPSNWIPPDPDDVCRYIGDSIAIKARWSLSMDESEWGRLKNLLNDECAGHRIEPWADTGVSPAPPGGPTTTAPATTTAPPPPPPRPPATTVAVLPVLPQPPPTTAPPPPADVYYENCDAARAAGAAPVHRGEPGYASHLDRDDDGVGCE